MSFQSHTCCLDTHGSGESIALTSSHHRKPSSPMSSNLLGDYRAGCEFVQFWALLRTCTVFRRATTRASRMARKATHDEELQGRVRVERRRRISLTITPLHLNYQISSLICRLSSDKKSKA
eukprot:g683.t1